MTPAPNRRTFALLSLGMVAFIVYGSLVPFAFRARPLGDATESFAWAMANRALPESRSDGIANVLIAVPLGFALLGWACVDRPGVRRAAVCGLAMLPACVLLAAAVEFAQLFLPTRTCAGSDVFAQGIGAALGMVVWVAVGQRLTGHARAVWAKADGSVPRLLIAYLVLLAFIQTLPLDLTPSPADLYRKFRDTVRYVPFGEFRGASEADCWKRIGTLCQVFALYLPVGLLAARLPRPPVGALRLALLAVGVALGMESLQLVVQSRVPSATDVVVGACGAVCGWLARRSPPFVVAYLALLVVHAWQPWTARTDAVAFDWIPGLPLEEGDPLFSLEEFLTKTVLFAPLGMIARRPPLAALGGAALAMVLEVGQLFVSSRYPCVTDVLIGGLGAYIAACLHAVLGGDPKARRAGPPRYGHREAR